MNLFGSQSLLKGRVVFEPEYKTQELKEYENNPFIEALPDIFEVDEVVKQFTIYPHVDDDERKKRTVVRHHMIKRLKHFVQPLEIHLDIERKLSTIIRQGYLARNPFSYEFLQRLQLLNKVKEEIADKQIEKLEELNQTLRSTAASFSIVGISGIGKTTAIERLLLMYDQVIIHIQYSGKPMTRTQIVWLKIDCPYDGSLKTLCKTFFKAVDDVLGTTRYFEKYGNNRNSTGTMMIHMTYVATVHAIGVLVIDEMQHLLSSKYSADEMLNFFVTLVNIIGVPTILIGTFKALKVLQKDFRQARRASSEGSIIWDRMVKDEEWDFFLDTMWQFQWLDNFSELTDKLNAVMYDESQGITAIAVILFILSQEWALEKSEKITEELIRKVAKKELQMIQKMIKALRNNDLEEIIKYDDISIRLDDILGKTKRRTDLRGKIQDLAKQQQVIRDSQGNDLKEAVLSDLRSMKMFDVLKYDELQNIVENAIKIVGIELGLVAVEHEALKIAMEKINEVNIRKNRRIEQTNTNEKLLVDDLRHIYKEAQKEKKHVYEFLKQRKYIKNPHEEFYIKSTIVL